VPESGSKNTSFGVYQNDCCKLEIVIAAGVEFPACPNHPYRTTNWTPIEIDIARLVKKKSQSESAA
jgi:hypothetical protein